MTQDSFSQEEKKALGVVSATDDFDVDDYHRKHILLYRWIGWCSQRINKGSRWVYNRFSSQPLAENTPTFHAVPVRHLMIFSLAVTCFTLVTLLLLHYNSSQSMRWHFYLGLLLFVSLWVPEMINRQLKTSMRALGEQSREFWKMLCEDIRLQWLPGFLYIFLGGFLFTQVFKDNLGEWPGLPLFVPVVILSFLWGLGGYISIIASLIFIEYINKKDDLPLYPFNPQKSLVLAEISQVFEAALFYCSLALVAFIAPLVLFRQTPLLRLIEFTIGVLGFGVLIGLFLFAQIQLSSLVCRYRAKTLETLQARISTLSNGFKEPISDEKNSAIDKLIARHDQIANAGGWGLSTTRLSFYLRSFILPIGAIALPNLKSVIDLLNTVLGTGM